MSHEVEYKPLTRDELEKLAGEELSERAATLLLDARVAAPVEKTLEVNVASENSNAYASASRTSPAG